MSLLAAARRRWWCWWLRSLMRFAQARADHAERLREYHVEEARKYACAKRGWMSRAVRVDTVLTVDKACMLLERHSAGGES